VLSLPALEFPNPFNGPEGVRCSFFRIDAFSFEDTFLVMEKPEIRDITISEKIQIETMSDEIGQLVFGDEWPQRRAAMQEANEPKSVK
jgi:hypothetical protein